MKRPTWSPLRVLIASGFVLAGLALLIGLVIAVFMYFDPSIQTGRMVKENAYLGALPQPLPDRSVAVLAGARESVFGNSIQFPWEKLRYSSVSESSATFLSYDGIGVTIYRRPIFSSDFQSADNARDLNSDYARKAAQVETTPDDVKWWASRKHNERAASLLSGKFLDMLHAKSIYRMNLGDMRGFQFDDPQSTSFLVLQLFDRTDQNYEVHIIQAGPTKDRLKLTQAQINAIVASMHPLP